MSLPWEKKPSPPPAPQPQPQYQQPPVQYPPPPPPQPQPQPQPDSTRRKAPIANDSAAFDLRATIQRAVNEAIANNKDAVIGSVQKQLKPAKSKEDDSQSQVESSFQGGPVTTRTFIQGMAVDIGFAVTTALALAIGPDFNAFDAEAWTIVGALVAKTLIQTTMSYVMKLQVK